MKCKNLITSHIFDVSEDECKKLLEEFDCFAVINPTREEKLFLEKVEKKNLSIKEKVMGKKRKEC